MRISHGNCDCLIFNCLIHAGLRFVVVVIMVCSSDDSWFLLCFGRVFLVIVCLFVLFVGVYLRRGEQKMDFIAKLKVAQSYSIKRGSVGPPHLSMKTFALAAAFASPVASAFSGAQACSHGGQMCAEYLNSLYYGYEVVPLRGPVFPALWLCLR